MNDSADPPVKIKIKPAFIWPVFVALLILTVYLFYTQNMRQPDEPLQDVYAELNEQGYTANMGFSGNYQPGTIIQTHELDERRKQRQLKSALVVLWADQCFPDKETRTAQYILPDNSGSSRASIEIAGKFLGKFFPALQLDSETVMSYKLNFENTQTKTFARLDLSQNLSQYCVLALEKDITAGAKPEWFSVIQEAIIADAIHFELQWQTESTLVAREEIKSQVMETIDTLLSQIRGTPGTSPDIQSRIELDNQQNTVISAKSPVIIAYRARQLEPVYENP